MYQPLLTNRYLTSRVIPLIAVAAVALCVALVIIVVSVMTGFLNLVRDSGRTLMGDVIISYSSPGIPYYERLVERIEAAPEAAAACPVVESWGLLKMPYPIGPSKDIETVQAWGVDPAKFARVTQYGDTLFWKPPTPAQLESMREDDFRRTVQPNFLREVYNDGLALRQSASNRPGMSAGIQVSAGNRRQRDGTYEPLGGGHWWMPLHEVTLTVLPVGVGGGFAEPQSAILPVVNEFQSGVFIVDDKRVIIPLDLMQRLVRLDESKLVDDEGEPTGQISPARATMVLVRAAEGVTPQVLRQRVEQVYDEFFAAMMNDASAAVKPPARDFNLSIKTWEEQQAEFIGPIEKERELMRTLFSLIYLVCAGLVLAIFWAIVYEKTRDIGILRSIGASRLGISWIFVRYGFIVGVLGAIVGLGLAFLVIHNINAIHTALGDPPWMLGAVLGLLAVISLGLTIARSLSGRLLPLVLGTLVTFVLALFTALVFWLVRHGGVVIWNPEVYYFSRIPNEVDYESALITMIGAVVFSLIGSFLPAAKAADTDPVTALRYE